MKLRLTRYTVALLIIVLLTVMLSCTGKPTVQWSKTFPFPIYSTISVKETADGGYIMCGNNVLMKTDSTGNKVWDKSLVKDNVDFFSAQQTTDGGYMVCGTTYNPQVVTGDAVDIWLIKTDASGNKTWEKTFLGAESLMGGSAKQTTDGGYIICAIPWFEDNTKSGIWLIKTDANGDKLWDKIFSGALTFQKPSVQQTKDNGYIICGTTETSEFYSVIWLIRTDVDGNEIWDKTYINEDEASGGSAQQTSDGGYIVCGSYQIHSKSETDIWLIKADANGNRLWDKTFAGDLGISAQQTTDGGYIVYGEKYCPMESLCFGRVSLIKTDANGNQLWKERFAGQGEAFNGDVQQTVDGGYIMCVCTWPLFWPARNKNAMLIKISPEQ
jgi:hypothetical protein